MNPLRLDIQGGQEYLPFAKKKLRQLKASMKKRRVTNDNMFIKLEDATIYVQSTSYRNAWSDTSGGGYFDGSGSADGGSGASGIVVADTTKPGVADPYGVIFGGTGVGGGVDGFGVGRIGGVGGGLYGRGRLAPGVSDPWLNDEIIPAGAGVGAFPGITNHKDDDSDFDDKGKTSGGMDLIRIRGLKKPVTLILIHIAITTDPFTGLKKDDYRVLTYKIITSAGSTVQLKPANVKLKQLNIEDNGQNLVIQSSPDEILATLPSVFTFNPIIDNTDAMDRTWGAVDNLFGRNRLIGSPVAMLPSGTVTSGGRKGSATPGSMGSATPGSMGSATPGSMGGLAYSFNARGNYVLNAQDKSVESLDYCWKSTHLGFGLFYVGLMAYNGGIGRTKVRWYIQYRDIPNGPWKIGALIGEDYEDPNPFADGYSWKFHVPIAALSPTQALLKTVRKEQASSIFGVRQAGIDININVLRRCSSDVRSGSFTLPCELGKTYYYESLHMGSVPLEDLTYSEIHEAYPTILIEYWMVPMVSTRAWCGDWPNYLVDINATVTVSGNPGISLPVLKIYYDGRTIHPAYADGHFKSQNKGAKDLHVMMYDNINADDTFIVFYAYTEIDVTEEGYYEPGVKIVYHSTNSSTAHYTMAYRLKGGGLTKVALASGTNSVGAVSCQIYKDLIVYTYRYYEHDKFQHRVTGIINMASGQRDEFISNDNEPQLAGFPLSGLAAIGLA
ncbi:MAG: hypothetical protein HQL05_04535 [Nitrospirae bacterium]|nr:hypothetical protein [Nitrospirota bacterium]